MRRILRGMLLGGALLCVGVAPAVAGQIHHERWIVEDVEFVWQECDGFDIIAIATFWGVDNVFEEPDGDLRFSSQQGLEATLYHSETGDEIGAALGRSVLLAPIDGQLTSTYVGMRIMESYIDGGSFVSIGRIEYDGDGVPIFVAGPHPFETEGVDRCALVAA